MHFTQAEPEQATSARALSNGESPINTLRLHYELAYKIIAKNDQRKQYLFMLLPINQNDYHEFNCTTEGSLFTAIIHS